MSQRVHSSTNRTLGGLLAAAVATGAFAAAALGLAPAANATCASFFGIGSGGRCTSNPTSIAIAIGPGAVAHADGILGAAISLGAHTYSATADLEPSTLDFALAVGDEAQGYGDGIAALGLGIGNYSFAAAGADTGRQIANVAIDLTNHSVFNLGVGAETRGVGDTAINIGGDSGLAIADGVNLSTAINLFGNNEVGITSPGFGNLSFGIFGHNNTVYAGPGPFAVAGSIFQTGATVTKTGAGFNINGVKVGGAAAVKSAASTRSTASHASAKAHSKR